MYADWAHTQGTYIGWGSLKYIIYIYIYIYIYILVDVIYIAFMHMTINFAMFILLDALWII